VPSTSRSITPSRRKKLEDRIRKCDAERSRLAAQLLAVDYIWHGSVTRRFQTCGQSSCRCHQDTNARHGPYAHWTTKIGGKTVSRLLTAAEADLYESWIKNRRHIEQTIAALKKISAKVAPLILESKAMEPAIEHPDHPRAVRRARKG
jgi:hypothetical protein